VVDNKLLVSNVECHFNLQLRVVVVQPLWPPLQFAYQYNFLNWSNEILEKIKCHRIEKFS